MPGYISELRYSSDGSGDFVELAIPTGTDVSGYTVQIYDNTGSLVFSFGLGTATQTVAGNDVYVVDDGTPGWSGYEAGQPVALVDGTGSVVQFISFDGSVTAVDGDAAGLTSEDKGEGDAEDGQSMQSDDGGSTYYTQNSANAGTIPCYAPGMLINTPDGPRAVETLRVGDRVMTADHGPQTIRWVRSGLVPLEDADASGKPVLIRAGALGRGLPAQDLIVSPQHRILVGGHGQLQAIFAREASAPAKALTGLPGIRHMMGRREIVWYRFACDRHEIVTANGCQSESLLLGPMVVQGMTFAERRVMRQIFQPTDQHVAHDGATILNGSPARPCLRVGEVRKVLARVSRRVPIPKLSANRDLGMEVL